MNAASRVIYLVIICICSEFFPITTVMALDANRVATKCNPDNTPKIIKHMEDWDIIADNVATINMAPSFSGGSLAYSIQAHPQNPSNIVNINSQTGIITIDAEARDNFNIAVVAKNACGSSSLTFNVQIDEDDDE